MNNYFSIIKFQFLLMTLLTFSSLQATTLIANAGEDINVTLTPSNPTVTLDGTASTSSETIVNYEWFYDGERFVTGSTLAVASVPVGYYTVTLVVTDSLGNTASDTVNIEVHTLSANAGEDINVTLTPSNPSLTLDGTASTSSETIVKYEWFYDGERFGTGSTLAVASVPSGYYTVTLVVTDDLGNTDSDTVNVKVQLEGEPPVTNYNIVLKSTQEIAGYEIHLKFTETMPLENTLILNNDFLASTGRTVNNLGPDINATTKQIKFGAFTFGNNDGVAGEFIALSFELMEGDISIIEQTCVDKNASKITCDIQIQRN